MEGVGEATPKEVTSASLSALGPLEKECQWARHNAERGGIALPRKVLFGAIEAAAL